MYWIDSLVCLFLHSDVTAITQLSSTALPVMVRVRILVERGNWDVSYIRRLDKEFPSCNLKFITKANKPREKVEHAVKEASRSGPRGTK